jgi:uncharacterized protein YndB with AHSA1/START domain
MEKDKITIGTLVSAKRPFVWDCYTNPEHIVNWNFATPDWHCPSAENNLVVGGKYKARMEAKDGSYGFDFEATHTSINHPESFTYVLEDGRTVDVTFTESGGSTEVTVTFDPETQNPLDMQRSGWQAILDNFRKYVEQN